MLCCPVCLSVTIVVAVRPSPPRASSISAGAFSPLGILLTTHVHPPRPVPTTPFRNPTNPPKSLNQQSANVNLHTPRRSNNFLLSNHLATTSRTPTALRLPLVDQILDGQERRRAPDGKARRRSGHVGLRRVADKGPTDDQLAHEDCQGGEAAEVEEGVCQVEGEEEVGFGD